MREKIRYSTVFGLLLMALILSAFHSPVWYDDAGHFIVAQNAAKGMGICYPIDSEGNCEANSPFITMGPVLTWPIALFLRLTGGDILAARLFMVFLSMCMATLFFLLAKWLGNRNKALIAVILIGVNIQFLTYGAEVLAEVPMMGLILAGLWAFLVWEKSGKIVHGALGIAAWLLAVAVKEYAMLPLSCFFFTTWIAGIFVRKQVLNRLLLGLVWAIALSLLFFILHGGFEKTMIYLLERQSYGSEFLAFNFSISLKFLLLKPLIWLGTVAILIKMRIRKQTSDYWMLCLQLSLLLFYLISAGYDRFGMLLIFIPAIYLAEFVPYLWVMVSRNPKWKLAKRASFCVLFLAIFGQQTPIVFGKRIVFPAEINRFERELVQNLPNNRKLLIFDQQIIPFMPKDVHWRLVQFVPSKAALCKKGILQFEDVQVGDLLVAGPYALTEYNFCIQWDAFKLLPGGNAEYQLYECIRSH